VKKSNRVEKKKPDRKKLIKKLDETWSLLVRQKCMCELCGARGDIKSFDAHHVVRRSHLATRWDVGNGACACKGCHRFKIHMDTMQASRLVTLLKASRGKDWYENLLYNSYKIVKYSVQDLTNILMGLEEPPF
jgi:hypothetical protein